MLFVSDLDRTLIYSRKFILDPLSGEKFNVRLIETKAGEEISFMLESSINKLRELSRSLSFVPVTTRTLEQYQRIHIFQNEIIPPFAIVSNGGNILINNEIDKEWNNIIRSKVLLQCLPLRAVLEEFDKVMCGDWVISKRHADDLFLYFIIDQNAIPFDELNYFELWLKANGWAMSLQGRKLYFVPNCITKWNAIFYIKELACAGKTCAAGDSLLDLCMLEMADFAIAPRHGEVARILEAGNNTEGKIHITKSSGIHAADEILDYVREYMTYSSYTEGFTVRRI